MAKRKNVEKATLEYFGGDDLATNVWITKASFTTFLSLFFSRGVGGNTSKLVHFLTKSKAKEDSTVVEAK